MHPNYFLNTRVIMNITCLYGHGKISSHPGGHTKITLALNVRKKPVMKVHVFLNIYVMIIILIPQSWLSEGPRYLVWSI